MKRLITLLIALLASGCAQIPQAPTYARIYDYQDPIRVITAQEIAELPNTLSVHEMFERFGPSVRCAVDLGIYPRFSKDIDYSKVLGEKATEDAFMFIPDRRKEDMISAIARVDKFGAVIIWPKATSGLTLEKYWNPQK